MNDALEKRALSRSLSELRRGMRESLADLNEYWKRDCDVFAIYEELQETFPILKKEYGDMAWTMILKFRDMGEAALDAYDFLDFFVKLIWEDMRQEERRKRNPTNEQLYRVHVLPNAKGYLTLCTPDDDIISGSFLGQRDLGDRVRGYKSEFTMSEIEQMKQNDEFKGIDFDGCLEGVPKE